MTQRIRIVGVILALLVLIGAGCSPTNSQGENAKTNTKFVRDISPITIGWMGPLSGDAASIGSDALAGARLAVEEVNASGGINGHILNLIIEDTKCMAKEAVNAAHKLIDLDKVPVIVGALCSGATTAAAPVAEASGTVLFSGCSSAPDITNAGDYIFRSYPSDSYQGKFSAEYLYNVLGKHKVALLTVQSPWGLGVADNFKKRFAELGGSVVADEEYDQTTKDLRTELTKIKATNPDALYFLSYTEAALVGLRQAHELKLDATIVGGDVWDDAKVIESPYAEGLRYTVPSANVPDAWREALKAKGGDVTICVPGTYNNVKILADIMSRVGADSNAIKDELYKVKNFPGVNGPVTLDENGDIESASFMVKEIRNGEAVEVK